MANTINTGGTPTATVTSTGSTGSSGQTVSAGSTPRKRRLSGTGFERKPGRRVLKEYPLTEGDMRALAAIGILATICFSGAAGALGFWINVSMSLALSGPLTTPVKAVWETYRTMAAWAAPILFLLGCGLLILGNSEIGRIKRDTSHES